MVKYFNQNKQICLKYSFTLWYRFSLYSRMKELERKRDTIIVRETSIQS
jgi:hypothetical protein